MPFRRASVLAAFPSGDKLTRALVGIGVQLAGRPLRGADIEDTLIAASNAGMEQDDFRVLALLVTWLTVHHPFVNADRLIRAIGAIDAPRTRAFWAAMAQGLLKKDRRFRKLSSVHCGEPIDLLRIGNAFQLRRRGEDARFANTALRVPGGVLRDRPADVLSCAALATRHRVYRCRVQMGPSYRADMWAALKADPSLTTAALARKASGSFATAWQVKHDFALLCER